MGPGSSSTGETAGGYKPLKDLHTFEGQRKDTEGTRDHHLLPVAGEDRVAEEGAGADWLGWEGFTQPGGNAEQAGRCLDLQMDVSASPQHVAAGDGG